MTHEEVEATMLIVDAMNDSYKKGVEDGKRTLFTIAKNREIAEVIAEEILDKGLTDIPELIAKVKEILDHYYRIK